MISVCFSKILKYSKSSKYMESCVKGGIIGLFIAIIYFIFIVTFSFCTGCCMSLVCRLTRFFTPLNPYYNIDLFRSISVILLGILIGWIMGEIEPRKKRSYEFALSA